MLVDQAADPVDPTRSWWSRCRAPRSRECRHSELLRSMCSHGITLRHLKQTHQPLLATPRPAQIYPLPAGPCETKCLATKRLVASYCDDLIVRRRRRLENRLRRCGRKPSPTPPASSRAPANARPSFRISAPGSRSRTLCGPAAGRRFRVSVRA